MKRTKTVTEFKHLQFKEEHKWKIDKIKSKKNDKNQKGKSKVEILKKEYVRYKKSVKKFETNVGLLKQENISLIRNNEGLLKKLNGEREEFDNDLENMFVLFFNTIKKVSRTKFSLFKRKIKEQDMFTEEETTKYIDDAKNFVELIPLLSKPSIYDKKNKKKLFIILKEVFEYKVDFDISGEGIIESIEEEEQEVQDELPVRLMSIGDSNKSYTSDNYSQWSDLMKNHNGKSGSLNKRSLSSLFNKRGKSFEKKSSHLSTRSYENSSQI